MSKPDAEFLVYCSWCDNEVLMEDYDKVHGCCDACYIASPENQANLKADEQMDRERDA